MKSRVDHKQTKLNLAHSATARGVLNKKWLEPKWLSMDIVFLKLGLASLSIGLVLLTTNSASVFLTSSCLSDCVCERSCLFTIKSCCDETRCQQPGASQMCCWAEVMSVHDDEMIIGE